MEETLRGPKVYVPQSLDNSYVYNVDSLETFAVIGDAHLNASTPKTRIDNYADTSIEKLELLRRTLIERGVKKLFMLGDVFHKATQPTVYENRIISQFLKFKESRIEVFVIFGNHDEINDRLDSYDRTTLGLLILTGVVKHFTKVTFNRPDKMPIVVTGLPYPNDIQGVTDFQVYNILMAHMFYNYSLDKDSLEKADLEKYGYNMYILGHDHMPYDNEKVETDMGKVSVIRPGAFMRGTSHNYNTKRLVNVDYVTISKEGISVKRDVLPVKPPEEVFPASVLDKVLDKDLSKNISKQLSDLITKMYELGDKNNSVYTVLDASPVDIEIKKNIEMYLEQEGIFRKNIEPLQENV